MDINGNKLNPVLQSFVDWLEEEKRTGSEERYQTLLQDIRDTVEQKLKQLHNDKHKHRRD